MNASNVISIDPGQKTLGTLNMQGAPTFLRKHVITEQAAGKRGKRVLLNTLFARCGISSGARSLRLVIMRVVFAGLLTICGIMRLTSVDEVIYDMSLPHIASIIMFVVASSLATGLLVRPVSSIATLLWGILGVMQLLVGEFVPEIWFCAFGTLVFAVSGAGRYSLDGLARHLLSRERREGRKSRKLASKRMSYEAFKYANR